MNINKLFPELHGDESLYEVTRTTMENTLQLLDITYTVRDRRHAPLSQLESTWSYMYNFYVHIKGKKYSFLVGDFSAVVDERVVEIYPIDDEAHRFYYTEFKHVLNALSKGTESNALRIIYQ